MNTMKIYIAGKITGNPKFKDEFAKAEKMLLSKGHTTMSPANLSAGFEHHEYMKICFSMIDVCEAVYLLKNWRDSVGASMEHEYARIKNKVILYEI